VPFHQTFVDGVDQLFVFEYLVRLAHPGLPQFAGLFGDDAIAKLKAAKSKTKSCADVAKTVAADTSLTAIDLGATSLLASNIFQGTAAQIYQNPNAVVTEVSSSSSDQAWLTIGGIVSLSHDNRTRLVRYAYGSGKELDSMAIDDTWMAAINFEDSGSYWYYYDRYTGCLFKMRSWWK